MINTINRSAIDYGGALTETGERIGYVPSNVEGGTVTVRPSVREPLAPRERPAPSPIPLPSIPESSSPLSPLNDSPIANINVTLPGSATNVSMPSPNATRQSFLDSLGISPTVLAIVGGLIFLVFVMKERT